MEEKKIQVQVSHLSYLLNKMFIKDKTYKLIISSLILIFIVILFFSARFLKTQIYESTTSKNVTSDANFNPEAWEKIKHRFVK